ncbi:MAG: glycosyltransferase family 9 protein [Lentisphaeria bacterium]|nr:glycosyltransferase family 9 protein [Lentisphaeria bacterium]
MNILIIKPSSLGDVVHAFPAVSLIHARHPEATITWVVNDTYAEVVELFPHVDDVALFKRGRWGNITRWHEFLAFANDLRKRKFDLIIDFQGLFRSGLLAFLAGGTRRVGFARSREGASLFYTEKILTPANIHHAVEKNLFLAASAVGVPLPDTRDALPEMRRSHDGEKQADILFHMHHIKPGGKIVAVAPAARWKSKMFPPEFFAKVMDRVTERHPDVTFWILGTENERPVGEMVLDACHQCRPEILMGEANLVTLVEMLRRSDTLLTNDTGPMHLAAAFGCPVVALFSSTNPDLTGPYGRGHVVLQGSCQMGPCLNRECPRKGEQVCAAESVSVSEAAAAVCDNLQRNALCHTD